MEKILEKVEEGREEELDLADVRITVHCSSILVKTTALIYRVFFLTGAPLQNLSASR